MLLLLANAPEHSIDKHRQAASSCGRELRGVVDARRAPLTVSCSQS